jgi:hypothetical protein
LQRYSRIPDNWFLLDRHRGLTLKVPDGRGKLVSGCTFNSFEQRHTWREQFESMRLLYVAATRARDRLILSGTIKNLDSFGGKSDTWLKWIWQSLELPAQTQSGIVDLTAEVQLQLTLNLANEPQAALPTSGATAASEIAAGAGSLSEAFPLLRPIEPERDRAIHRFSVTQLINYQRCPRQYYFDRVLHAPSAEAIATWNDAEAPEPPANLTATLKGAVIHRFCETFRSGDEPSERLLQSFRDVTAARQAELAERWLEIDTEKVIRDLLPLAENYLSSKVFQRVEAAERMSASLTLALPGSEAGLWSELPFRLRQPLGILTGAIDKLLITKASDGDGFDIEIIDFKTNRFPRRATVEAANASPELISSVSRVQASRRGRGTAAAGQQIAFDFSVPTKALVAAPDAQTALSISDEVVRVASDYQLQMQAYALAVRELMPSLLNDKNRLTVTLHFLDPNVEFHLTDELLEPAACEHAIDEAMREIVAAREPEHFPVRPATHCRMCNFLQLCYAGREWLKTVNRKDRKP